MRKIFFVAAMLFFGIDEVWLNLLYILKLKSSFWKFCIYNTRKIQANYDIILLTTEAINPDNTEIINVSNMKVKKLAKNENPKLVGDIIIYGELNETVKFEGQIYQKQGYEYRKLAYHLKTTCCELVEKDEVFYPSWAECHGLPRKVKLSIFKRICIKMQNLTSTVSIAWRNFSLQWSCSRSITSSTYSSVWWLYDRRSVQGGRSCSNRKKALL